MKQENPMILRFDIWIYLFSNVRLKMSIEFFVVHLQWLNDEKYYHHNIYIGRIKNFVHRWQFFRKIV